MNRRGTSIYGRSVLLFLLHAVISRPNSTQLTPLPRLPDLTLPAAAAAALRAICLHQFITASLTRPLYINVDARPSVRPSVQDVLYLSAD